MKFKDLHEARYLSKPVPTNWGVRKVLENFFVPEEHPSVALGQPHENADDIWWRLKENFIAFKKQHSNTQIFIIIQKGNGYWANHEPIDPSNIAIFERRPVYGVV